MTTFLLATKYFFFGLNAFFHAEAATLNVLKRIDKLIVPSGHFDRHHSLILFNYINILSIESETPALPLPLRAPSWSFVNCPILLLWSYCPYIRLVVVVELIDSKSQTIVTDKMWQRKNLILNIERMQKNTWHDQNIVFADLKICNQMTYALISICDQKCFFFIRKRWINFLNVSLFEKGIKLRNV